MESGHLNLSLFALVGVIMLVLSCSSFVYLLQVHNKSNSSWMLLWFFLCVIFSSLATILTNSGLSWEWAFAPTQDAMIILGGVFLVRFAYTYPSNDQPGEARNVTAFFVCLALVALSYSLFFAVQYLSNLPADTDEIQAYYLMTPLSTVIMIIIFFRRAHHCSNKLLNSAEAGNTHGRMILIHLIKPNNQEALALRNFGLALAVALIPMVVTVVKAALPPLIASFLFNFGVVVAFAVIMLVYLNHAPEPTTITAKLVGISMVTVMIILGLASVWFLLNIPGDQVHATVMAFIFLVLLSSLSILFIFPLFFRSTLLQPLERLLHGVRAANDGNLDIQVEVKYEDEIGFITRSFNRLINNLNEVTQTLKSESALLERQVAQRTAELTDSNTRLLSENLERKEAQARLDRQLRYEQALAGCSRSLLAVVEEEKNQGEVLNHALEHLRAGIDASRAYIFRNFQDPALGPCIGMKAEACAPEIQPHLNVPVNNKFPWSHLPPEMFQALQAGEPFGGPVYEAFASTPDLIEAFLHQQNPLLSTQSFPIFFEAEWWGFVGFDDCVVSRHWDSREILMLRTASEIIGSTLQRWQAEANLRNTLNFLEQRVQERTSEFARANAELRHEIHERERFQNELENRLETERILAKISARLLSPIELNTAIRESLADLGTIMQAERVVFIQMPVHPNSIIDEIIAWQAPGTLPLAAALENNLFASSFWFRNWLDSQESIYIEDLATQPGITQAEIVALLGDEIKSLVLTPLLLENNLVGVIVCSNSSNPKYKIIEDLQSMEVVAGMLGSLISRQMLLNTLEEKVAERTRELSAFFDMIMLAGEAREIADVMHPALMKIIEISASEAALIHLYDEEQQVLRLVAQRGFPSEHLSQLQTIQVDKSMISWLAHRDDFPSAENAQPEAILKSHHFQSSSHVTLRARGKILGLLSSYRSSELPFTSYQVVLLNAIGEQLGIAVENYHLRLEAEEIATLQERQRLARELHDAVSQSIYSLTLFARSGRDALEVGDQAKLLESLEQVETNSLTALKEMRLLLYQLRSLALQEGGLFQAIEARFNLVERRSGIQASVGIDESMQLSSQVEQELFRLVSEALNNALKHAGASQVYVTIRLEAEHLVLEVQDNGASFDPDQEYAGMGLQNMHQRATALGGRLEISSHLGQGTCIRVQLPKDYSYSGEG
jgi:signal transduction histidine kinase/HAMP domain-containing protein